MKSEFVRQVLSIIESEVHSRPSPIEFEMAYQGRLAVERIRFAIKTMEQTRTVASSLEEASLQLLDALDRLESADRHFQHRFRLGRAQAENGAHQDISGLRPGLAQDNHHG
jgi:hypothetical protein